MRNTVSENPKSSRRAGVGLALAERADQQIDVFDVLVEGPNLVAPLSIGRQLVETFRRRHAEQAAELAVARHPALAIAQDIRGCDVGVEAFFRLFRQSAQRVWVVVQDERPGIGRSQRVNHVVEAYLAIDARRAAVRDVEESLFMISRSSACPRSEKSSGISGCMR